MAPEMLRSVISAASETAVTSLLGGLMLSCPGLSQDARVTSRVTGSRPQVDDVGALNIFVFFCLRTSA